MNMDIFNDYFIEKKDDKTSLNTDRITSQIAKFNLPEDNYS